MYRVICPSCGRKIFEGEEERPLKLVLKNLNNKCPFCGAKLTSNIASLKARSG